MIAAVRRFAGREGEDGQAIVLIAIFLLTMLFAVGLAVDSGQLFVARRTAQEAADAASFAGAVVFYEKGTAVQAIAAATSDATLNGYKTDIPTLGTTVLVVSPPATGSFAGNVLCVQVTISTPVKTTLVPQESAFTTVTVHGTGCSAPQLSNYAVIALDQACDNGAVAISNNGTLAVHGGSIDINSCGAQAGQNTGTVTVDAGYETDVVGTVQGTWPNLHTGKPVQGDPFAGAPKPSLTGLPTYSPACSPSINQPGIYTSNFSNNCLYIFAPGNFIFTGAGLDLSGSQAGACTGSTCSTPTADGGVFFFFTNSDYPATTGHCASQPVKIEGGVNTTISAPTSGTYQGMLIWQDSICTQELDIGGGGSITTTGSIYAPSAIVSGNGTGSAVTLSQVVAKEVLTQNANFTINYSSGVTYQGSVPALVE